MKELRINDSDYVINKVPINIMYYYELFREHIRNILFFLVYLDRSCYITVHF